MIFTHVVCLTGPTGVGKTTFMNVLKEKGWNILSTGELFRSIYKDANDLAKNSNNPVAPDFFDEKVLEGIELKIKEVQSKPGMNFLALETYPRKPSQCKSLYELVRKFDGANVTFQVVILQADKKVCTERALKRDEKEKDNSRKQLDEVKASIESNLLWDEIESILNSYDINVKKVDVTVEKLI